MGLGFEAYLAAVLVLALFVLPLPGIHKTTGLNIEGSNVTFKFNPNTSIEGEAQARTYYMEGAPIELAKIEVATGWRPLWDFMSGCSHEVKHLKLDKTGDKEHEIIHDQEVLGVFGGVLPPWAWESECFTLVDDRLFL